MENTLKTERIVIANLKCDGCATTIRKKLGEIVGVEHVTVDHDTDTITVEHSAITPRKALTDKLHSLGYPEATEENGLLLKIKSYASCAVGRMNKDDVAEAK